MNKIVCVFVFAAMLLASVTAVFAGGPYFPWTDGQNNTMGGPADMPFAAAWDCHISLMNYTIGTTTSKVMQIFSGNGEEGLWVAVQKNLPQNPVYHFSMDVTQYNGWTMVRFNSLKGNDFTNRANAWDCGVLLADPNYFIMESDTWA